MAEHNELGHWGEAQAAKYLQSKGYRIVACNWRAGHIDIDIVAMDDDELVVVEVKTRRDNLFMEPEYAVDWRKRRSLCKAANMFVKKHCVNMPVRMDVITVIGTPNGHFEIGHIKDAFLPTPY